MFYLTRVDLKTIVDGYLDEVVVPRMRAGRYLGSDGKPRLQIAVDARVPGLRAYVALRNLATVDFVHPYDVYASGKARLSQRTRMFTREVVNLRPDLLEKGDVLYPGGVWFRGYTFGTSGLADPNDEEVGLQIAAECWSASMLRLQAEARADHAFVGEA